ncbi:hypothetical protein [Streptomyces sp. NRRL S-146]|uniref:hypothetical protein n=1 Tax=Streptomyces sp. NRRL S-146 TaxID=1463884 RepID=UPI0004C4AE7B|nr:hypothetical protein [Streptomyces sp. NRRL S-146]
MSSYASTLDEFDPLLGATPPNAPDFLDEEDVAEEQDEAAADDSQSEAAADGSGDGAPGGSSRSLAAVQVPSAVSEGLNASIQHALEAELPDDSAAPGEIITACEQRINAAQVLSDAMEKRAREAYFHYAGPAVRKVNRTEAWRHIEDPTTKKPYRSWSAWQRGNGISRQQAYRMVNEQPLVEALGLSYGDLGVRQVDVLTPVLKNHPGRLAELWRTAEEAGDTSAVSLLKIRDALGLSPATGDGQDGDEDTSDSKVPVLKFQAAPGAFDPARVDEATKASPEVARLIADRIYATLQAMEA